MKLSTKPTASHEDSVVRNIADTLPLQSGLCRYGLMTWPAADAFIGRSLALYGEWAQNEIDFTAQFVSHDSVILDIGSNIGTHAIAYSHLAPHGKVIAIEPQPAIFKILAANVRACAAGNIELIQSAAAEHCGQVSIENLCNGNQLNFGGVRVLDQASQADTDHWDRIPSISIDSLNQTRLDLVKIDVEGFELSVLKGMTSSIRRRRPVLLCEVLALKSGMELIDWFSSLGYSAWFVAFSAFSINNFKKNPRNEFPMGQEHGLLFLPEERPDPQPGSADLLTRIESSERFARAYIANTDALGHIACRIYFGTRSLFSEPDSIRFDFREDRLGEEIDLTVPLPSERAFTDLRLALADHRCVLRLIDSWIETSLGERIHIEPIHSNEDHRRGDTYYWLRNDPQLLFSDIPLADGCSVGFRIQYLQHAAKIDTSFDPLAAVHAGDTLTSQLYYSTDHRFSEGESMILHWGAEVGGEAAELKFQLPRQQSISSLCLTVAKTECAIRFINAWLEGDNGNRIPLLPSVSNESLRSGNTYYWSKDRPQMVFRDFAPGSYKTVCFCLTPLLHGQGISSALRHMIELERSQTSVEHSTVAKSANDTWADPVLPKASSVDQTSGSSRNPDANGESCVYEPDLEEIKEAIAADFDRRFYLDNNPDVRATGIDPVEHYAQIGWREGRDPHPEFSTRYYLELHPSVGEALMNPFYHWIISGKPAGIVNRGTHLQQILMENTFLEPAVEADWNEYECLSSEILADRIAARLDPAMARLVLAFGHDNYTQVVGGIQLCTSLEQKAFAVQHVTYLQVHPVVPAATILAPESSRHYVMGMVVDGESIGLGRAAEITTAIRILRQRFPYLRLRLVVHALLGHSTQFLEELCNSDENARAYFWVHDYYSICPMYNLLRNNILYCNAPDENSPACSTCIHGEERKRHRALLQSLFRRCNFDIIAPSQAALDLWHKRSGLPYRSSVVHEHARLIPTGLRRGANPDRLRVAFLGLPRYHKGWEAYARLVKSLQGDPRYEFYLFGKEEKLYPPVTWREVSVGLDNPNAMTEALRQEEIHVAVLWPVWPETFCIAAHEALAAGTFIVTSAGSGNIAAISRNSSRAMILSGNDRLIEAFRTGEVAAAALAALKNGIPAGQLSFSGISADILESGWE